ncbi:MAG: ATP-binding cassette domain-containing protein, partial [Nitrospina sp.]|nr:ATP-binding cassette domain-containing protein [Nitrospina sp.]
LISCLPTMDSCRHTNRLQGIPGQVWSGDILPTGCIFHPRCSYSSDLCSTQPSFQEKDGHGVRCWHWKELDIKKTFNPLKSSGKIPDLSDKTATLLKVENLKTFYKERSASMFKKDSASYVKAVNQVSFEVEKGGIVGIVGESGCGKSSLAKSIAGLEEPTAGIIELSGLDIAQRVESRNITTLQKLNMIFQNPDSSLNPTKTVGQSLRRALKLNKALVGKKKQEAELERLMEAIRIDKSYLERKPWQLSGGEKQRIAIARALASHPELLICDEPVSALDVSVQCSVINTLLDIRNRYGTSLLFISHDLAVVRYFCDQIIVMYLGKICEQSQASEITKPPYHPYTEALLSAAPITDLKIKQKRIHLEGTPPSPSNPPKGCFFHTRCHRKNGKACSQELPPLQISKSGKKIFCHRPLEILESFEPILNN